MSDISDVSDFEEVSFESVFEQHMNDQANCIVIDDDDDIGFRKKLIKTQNKKIVPLSRQTTKRYTIADYDSEIDEEEVVGVQVTGFKRPALEPVEDLQVVETDAEIKKGKGRGSLAQRYCFTWNNPSISGEEFKTFLESKEDVSIGVFQKEQGENGTPHFQGYFELKKRMYTTGVISMLRPYSMALLHAKGTKQQNEKYCTKTDDVLDGPWYLHDDKESFKRKTGNQGQRSDLDKFVQLVETEGGITDAVRDQMPGHAMRFNKHAKCYIADIKYDKAKQQKLDEIKADI